MILSEPKYYRFTTTERPKWCSVNAWQARIEDNNQKALNLTTLFDSQLSDNEFSFALIRSLSEQFWILKNGIEMKAVLPVGTNVIISDDFLTVIDCPENPLYENQTFKNEHIVTEEKFNQ